MSSSSIEQQKNEILELIEYAERRSESKELYEDLIIPLQKKFDSKYVNYTRLWNSILSNLEEIKMMLLQNEPFSPNYLLILLSELKNFFKIESESKTYNILTLESSVAVNAMFRDLHNASVMESSTGKSKTLTIIFC